MSTNKNQDKVGAEEIKNFLEQDDYRVKEVFDFEYQNKFIHVFLKDNEFADQIIDVVIPEFFESYQRILLEKILKYFNKHRLIPEYDTLKRMVNMEESNQMTKEHLNGLIDKIKSLYFKDEKHIKEVAYDFFKKQSVKNALFKVINSWKKSDYDGISNIIEDAMKAGEPKNVGHDYFKQIEKRLKKKFRNPIPCLDGLDSEIGGGLSGGELGIVIAPTGGGKSMCLVKFACTALLKGKKVVYYSLELSEDVIGQRFDSCLNDIRIKDVFDFPEVIAERLEDIEKSGGRLIIKSYPTGTASVNTFKSHLASVERTMGFVPDMIVVDYADIMKPTTVYSELRHTLTNIYEGLRGLAGEFNFPIWTASQTNRSSYDENIVTLKTIGESLGKAATADVIIGVGRTSEDKENKRAKIGLLKNRNGRDGFYLDAVFDTSRIDIRIISDNSNGFNLENLPTINEKFNIPGSINDILQRSNSGYENESELH